MNFARSLYRAALGRQELNAIHIAKAIESSSTSMEIEARMPDLKDCIVVVDGGFEERSSPPHRVQSTFHELDYHSIHKCGIRSKTRWLPLPKESALADLTEMVFN